MKCPNCSFNNAENATMCMICGYDLITNKKETASLDTRLDDYLNTPERNLSNEESSMWIEALQNDIKATENEFKHLRSSTHNKSPIFKASSLQEESTRPQEEEPPLPQEEPQLVLHDDEFDAIEEDVIEEDIIDIQLKEKLAESHLEFESNSPKPPNDRARIIMLIVILTIIILIFMFLSRNNSETISDGQPIESIETDVQDSSNQDPETQIDPDTNIPSTNDYSAFTDDFYDRLMLYVNDGNIAVLSKFVDSQSALEKLSSYKSKGSLKEIQVLSISGDEKKIDVRTQTIRTSNDLTSTSEETWTFSFIIDDDQTYVETLDILVNDESLPVESLQEVTQPKNLEGYITTGSFSGGTNSENQDLGAIRYGNHETFERLVFDMYEWNGTSSPTQVVEMTCLYETSIDSTGKLITLEFSGAQSVSAVLPHFSGNSLISSIKVHYPTPSTASIDIELKNPVAYKVFELQSPGRIVLDITSY